jgi:ABC-2 type transport system permease protein
MNALSSTWLLTRRTLTQFPRNPMVVGFAVASVLMMFLVFGTLFASVRHLPGFPTDNYYEYLAPAAVLMTTVPGIANSAVALATDFQNRYLYKLPTTPASIGSIMLGRLLADGARLFIQGGAVLVLALALGAQIATGLAGALLMLLIGTLFAMSGCATIPRPQSQTETIRSRSASVAAAYSGPGLVPT